ncbi:ABC transporter permease, partial [Streptomyces sp. TRM76130]|nr:ABC transporter permease [Streptomyces sp. TRM76130]
RSGGLRVTAARTDLMASIGAELADGSWLNAATSEYPAVVLGANAARQLGIHYAGPEVKVWLGGRWFTVVGLLAPNELLPDLDNNAMVGWAEAEKDLGFDGYPTSVYTRVEESAVGEVQAKLGATANPESPNQVDVSRP